jgi:hypothetical protein
MDPEQARIAAAQLLEDAVRSRAGATSEWVKRMLSPEYWRELNPDLTIEAEERPEVESRLLDEGEQQAVTAQIADRGYFHTAEVLSPAWLSQLLGAVESVQRAGWPATACFVYDEFWQVARTPSPRALLRRTLGEGYAQIPKVWCHYVNPSKRSRGWRPHIDGRPQGARDHRLTVWVPLTEATLDNGCIYVIPRDLMPPEGLDDVNVRNVLPATRAVPAHPGELLGWDHDTWHWGSSVSGDAVTPRISLSFEFLGAEATPFAEEQPLLDMDSLPSFEQRARFIARGVVEYVKFEPLLALHGDAFRQTLERLPAQSDRVTDSRSGQY